MFEDARWKLEKSADDDVANSDPGDEYNKDCDTGDDDDEDLEDGRYVNHFIKGSLNNTKFYIKQMISSNQKALYGARC